MGYPIVEMENRLQAAVCVVDPDQVAPLKGLASVNFMIQVFRLGAAFIEHGPELLRLARIGAETEAK